MGYIKEVLLSLAKLSPPSTPAVEVAFDTGAKVFGGLGCAARRMRSNKKLAIGAFLGPGI